MLATVIFPKITRAPAIQMIISLANIMLGDKISVSPESVQKYKSDSNEASSRQ